MAETLFSMYCGKHAISGMYEELERANDLLDDLAGEQKAMVLFYMNGTEEWIYGQCNFLHDQDHDGNFKFSNRFGDLIDQEVLPTLIAQHGVTAVYFPEERLMRRFATHSSTARYSRLFTVPGSPGPAADAIEQKPQSFFAKMRSGLLSGGGK